MAALDTNIVIRLLVGDDALQAKAAQQLVAQEPCSVSPSVLMECEWVLRAAYQLDVATIEASFRSFLALEHISCTELALIQRVLDAYAQGVDFADAFHAAQCKEGEMLMTFDKQFTKRAPKAGLTAVKLLKS